MVTVIGKTVRQAVAPPSPVAPPPLPPLAARRAKQVHTPLHAESSRLIVRRQIHFPLPPALSPLRPFRQNKVTTSEKRSRRNAGVRIRLSDNSLKDFLFALWKFLTNRRNSFIWLDSRNRFVSMHVCVICEILKLFRLMSFQKCSKVVFFY